MSEQLLDNPIWHSLRTRHAGLAVVQDQVRRYPAEFAPFLAVASGDVDASAAIAALLAADESIYLLGPRPQVPSHWRLQGPIGLAQMVCSEPQPEPPGPPLVELSAIQRPDVLALAALVYPHYFRPRSMELGRYFGIYQDGRLAAMVGERMATEHWQEISAVCTHPEYVGRGYARRLLVWLSNDVLAQGRTPFLHVAQDNTRAKQLYLQNGYRQRSEIDFWALRRPRP